MILYSLVVGVVVEVVVIVGVVAVGVVVSSILREANLANFLDQLAFSEEFNLDKK